MDSQRAAERSLSKLFINITAVLIFMGLMAGFIAYSYRSEPNIHATAMAGFARQFQQSAENTRWQWQAEGRPQRIMLLHFNNQGVEKDRRPVRMTHNGRPFTEQSAKGCEALWVNLLNEPLQVEGSEMIADYFAAAQTEQSNADTLQTQRNEEVLGFCRFRLSRGPYFDYDLNTGVVTFKTKG